MYNFDFTEIMPELEFEGFPKIPRLSRDIVVTEKIDGTNGQIYIFESHPEIGLENPNVYAVDCSVAGVPGGYEPGPCYGIMAGSRKRWVTPEDDNFGFARWVWDNARELIDTLGPGKHFGEWYGSGIQSGYNLKEKRFALFNSGKWTNEIGGPASDTKTYVGDIPQLDVVPILYEGPFDTERIDWCIDVLREGGSFISPGFDKPEGVIIYHTQGNLYFKKTIYKDEIPKSVNN